MPIVLKYFRRVQNALLKEAVELKSQGERGCELRIDTVGCGEPAAFAAYSRPFRIYAADFSGTGEERVHRDG